MPSIFVDVSFVLLATSYLNLNYLLNGFKTPVDVSICLLRKTRLTQPFKYVLILLLRWKIGNYARNCHDIAFDFTRVPISKFDTNVDINFILFRIFFFLRAMDCIGWYFAMIVPVSV